MRTLVTTLLFITACAAADTTPAADCPPAAAGCADCAAPVATAEITLAELKELVAAKKVVLLDVNGSESFAKGHIPGAIDFTASKADLAKLLPAEKDALIVAYCGGPKCGAWKSGASAAAALGYTNIKHFAGGISGWTEAKAPLAN